MKYLRNIHRLVELLEERSGDHCERVPSKRRPCGRCWPCRVSKALKGARDELTDLEAKGKALLTLIRTPAFRNKRRR
jgi:hypothetical protein